MGYEMIAWTLALVCGFLLFLVGMLSGQVGTVEELRDLVDKIDGEEDELETK